MKGLKKFRHFQGFHCGSSSVRSILDHFGFKMSESFVLGIGQGLLTSYWESDSFSPTRILHNRSYNLEMTAFEEFGFCPVLRQTSDSARGKKALIDAIDHGLPLMIQVDIKDLEYFGTGTSFAGHKVIACGYDHRAKTVLISDNEYKEPQVVPMEQLDKARWAPETIYDLMFNWYEIKPPDKLPDKEELISKAIYGQAKKLMDGKKFFGLEALDTLAKRISHWKNEPDWKWAARFNYQIIEKRGTGGGAFRFEYSRFLSEAREIFPKIGERGLDAIMKSAADSWTELAYQFKKISESDSPHGFEMTVATIKKIRKFEREFCEIVLELFS